ncbi:MAG: hypothetical protein BYD32DRAFT_416338 [Podila humilis]|nr:MAG: hypothetical protein BYD32DRAFT_416338 [Podila humilis]
MPFLSLSNPRNRASLVAVLLLLELMTILWFRRSPVNERDPSAFPASPLQEQDLPFLLHRVTHKKSKNSYSKGHHERIEVQVEELKERSAKDDKSTTREQGQGQNNELMAKNIGHHHHRPVPDTPEKLRKPDHIEPTTTIPTVSLPSKVVAPNNKLREDSKAKTTKKTKNQKSKNAKEKGKGNRPQKSRTERKLGQLIPALDENGEIIEDHFISPRDSDGDGIPDYYVLLRPSPNDYMMDVGLFDEDVVVPPAPAVLSSVILASQPTAISEAPALPVSPMEAPPAPPPPAPDPSAV